MKLIPRSMLVASLAVGALAIGAGPASATITNAGDFEATGSLTFASASTSTTCNVLFEGTSYSGAAGAGGTADVDVVTFSSCAGTASSVVALNDPYQGVIDLGGSPADAYFDSSGSAPRFQLNLGFGLNCRFEIDGGTLNGDITSSSSNVIDLSGNTATLYDDNAFGACPASGTVTGSVEVEDLSGNPVTTD